MSVTSATAPQQVTAPSALSMEKAVDGSVSISDRCNPSVATTIHDSQQNQGWFKSIRSRLADTASSISKSRSNFKSRTATLFQDVSAYKQAIPGRISNGWISLKDCSAQVVQCSVIIGKKTVKDSGIGGIIGTGAALITTILCPLFDQ